MNITPINNDFTYKFNGLKKPEIEPHKAFYPQNNSSYYKYAEMKKNYNVPFLGKRCKKAKSEEEEKSVYIIDAYKNYRKFESVEEAAKTLKLSKSHIIKCANGDREYIGKGYISAFPDSVEEFGKPDTFLINLASGILTSLELENLPNLNSEIIKKSKQQISKDDVPTLKSIPPEDYKHLRADQLNNPFYVMDENFEFGKYFNKAHVGKQIGVTTSTVLKCVLGTSKLAGGYAMAPASEIETEDKDGKITLNLEILMQRFNANKKDYFYAIDENGKPSKFESVEEASKKLKTDYSNIIRCVLGQQKSAGGCAFRRRCDIEELRADGKVRIRTEVIDEIKKLLQEDGVYVIDPETKECTRYDDRIKAAEAVQTSVKSLLACIRGRCKTVNGKIAVNASQIETPDEDGKVKPNEDKVEKLIKSATSIERLDVSKEGFYVIKKDYCNKFFSIEKAGSELGINPDSISVCLKGAGHTAGGYVIAFPDEIETEDESGKTEVDKIKLAEKLSVLDRHALYAIRPGLCKRYNDRREAEKDLGISADSISECVNGRKKSAKNTAFLPASEVEKPGDGEKTEINETLLRDALSELTKYELYVFRPDGSFEKFPDRVSAAKKLGIDINTVRGCANGKRNNCYNDLIFVPANDIEIRHSDWTVTLNKEKLNEKLKPFTQMPDYPIEIVVNTLLVQLALIQRPVIE